MKEFNLEETVKWIVEFLFNNPDFGDNMTKLSEEYCHEFEAEDWLDESEHEVFYAAYLAVEDVYGKQR